VDEGHTVPSAGAAAAVCILAEFDSDACIGKGLKSYGLLSSDSIIRIAAGNARKSRYFFFSNTVYLSIYLVVVGVGFIYHFFLVPLSLQQQLLIWLSFLFLKFI